MMLSNFPSPPASTVLSSIPSLSKDDHISGPSRLSQGSLLCSYSAAGGSNECDLRCHLFMLVTAASTSFLLLSCSLLLLSCLGCFLSGTSLPTQHSDFTNLPCEDERAGSHTTESLPYELKTKRTLQISTERCPGLKFTPLAAHYIVLVQAREERHH